MDHDMILPLPLDIAIDCILRAPLAAHAALLQVSRSWRALASDASFYPWRRSLGYTDHYACFIQAFKQPASGKSHAYGISIFDARQRTWHSLPPPPQFPTLPLFCQCLSSGSRLILLGGWDPISWAVLPIVLVYDFATGVWSRGADMLSPASFFACTTLPEGSIVVAGGHDVEKNALRTAAVYDIRADTWRPLPDMTQDRDECKAVIMDGKLTVISGFSTDAQGQFCRSAETFDPCAGKWEVLDNLWPAAKSPASAAVVKGELYGVIDGKLMKHRGGGGGAGAVGCGGGALWEAVAEMPKEIKVAACATAVDDGIVVSGYGGAAESGGGAQACEASIWRFSCSRNEWRTVGVNQRFSGIVQAACTVVV